MEAWDPIYMIRCNREGLRVYPVLEHGKYQLVIETNKGKEFHPNDVLKVSKGQERYDPKGMEWQVKIKELYQHIYVTRLRPKSEAA